jgi:hypothetical protein
VHTQIVLERCGEASRRSVDGAATLGGSHADGIAVAGIPPAAVALEPCAAGLVLRPAVAGLRVGGHTVAPGSARLLRNGERATLLGLSIELSAPEPADATRAAAAALLREAAGGRVLPPGPHLVVVTGQAAGTRVALADELIVGRGRAAGVRVQDPAVSRRHARLRRGPEGVTLEDLGARNRSRLNGVAIERRPVTLHTGDRITVGETELVYEDGARRAGPPLDAAPPARGRNAPGPPLVAAAMLAAAAAVLGAVSSCGP